MNGAVIQDVTVRYLTKRNGETQEVRFSQWRRADAVAQAWYFVKSRVLAGEILVYRMLHSERRVEDGYFC